MLVPAITYYEALREVERRNANDQRRRLIDFCFKPDRFMPLTTTHLEEAALLWAQSRNTGLANAGNESLDGDAILCAQVLSLSLPASDYVVATTNIKHLSRFVNAAEWQTITA